MKRANVWKCEVASPSHLPRRFSVWTLAIGFLLSANLLFFVQPVRGAGVTIITHGYNSDTKTWVATMANAIASQAGGASQYTLTLANLGGECSELGDPINIQVKSFTRDPSSQNPNTTLNGEIIVKVDWSDFDSGACDTGQGATVPTAYAANVLAAVMLSSNPAGDGSISHPLTELPMHLIGHSRGGSLLAETARLLGQNGIWVDQLTTLDPHPMNCLLGCDDAADSVSANILFADNYWRANWQVDPNGEHIDGAYEGDLNGIVSTIGGIPPVYAHSQVHAYYHGTIDLNAANDGAGINIQPSWYNTLATPPRPARDAAGFRYSRIVGGGRPSSGLGLYAGTAHREPVTRTGTQWPNVGDVKINDPRFSDDIPVFTIGDVLGIAYRYQNHDSGVSVDVYLDADQNPYNNNSTHIAQCGHPASSASIPSGQCNWNTTGAQPGTYYLYARITDDTHVRYAYAPKQIVLQRPAGQEEATLTATADAYIQQLNPTQNIGTVDTLFTCNASSAAGRVDSLIKFNLSSIPSGSKVQSAELKLKQYFSTPSGSVLNLEKTSSSWTESGSSGVRWNNRPSVSTYIALFSAYNDPISVKSSDYPTLTNVVQSWINSPSQNYGFYLSDNAAISCTTLCSREHATAANRPRLVVAYTPPPERILRVRSSNPSSGVSITVSPSDNNGDNNGSTSFDRTYYDGTVVSLSAPSTTSGMQFQKWQRDGVDYDDTRSTTVTMNGNHTMTAIYVAPPSRIIALSGDLAFGDVQVGGTATRTLTIANTGNSTLNVTGIDYPTGFSGSWSGSIPSGDSHDVTVTFAPTAVTSYGGTVTVNSDATSGNNTSSASGTGTQCTTLPTPTPNCVVTYMTTTPTLSWSDVANESGYVVRIFSGGSCSGSPIHTSSQLAAGTTSYQVPGGVLSSGQDYSWQVQANGNGTTYCDSGWSSCCSFSISGGCPYTLSAPSTNFAAPGGSGSFRVYANSGCSWSAVPSTNWIQTSSSSSGTGTVTYTVSANTGAARTGTITVQDKVFTVQQSGTVTNGSRVAIVNPDHYRILKYGWRTDDYYYPIANGTVADNGSTTNVNSWTGLGACADYLTTVLTNAGYQVDTYTGDTFPVATVSDYALVIVQDPMTEINRQFSANVEDTAADLLQYTTNAVFLSRLDSYFSSGGSVILVGDAVRLLENGANRLNYGKVVLANNPANSVTSPSPVIPEHWLFIRGNPFCCHSRSGSATYTVAESALVPTGSVVSEVSLYDGRDMAWCHVWSDTIYSPSDAVSLLDVQIQGSGQYVLDGSICNPTVYQDTVTTTAPSLMGYTLVNGRKVFFLGSDSFFDYQYNSLLGVWHCSGSQGITSQITTNGISAILGLVAMAITNNTIGPVASFTASPTQGAVPLAVNFTDTSTGVITNRAWDFGDGGASAAPIVIHGYNSPGVYSVSLSVFGPAGADTLSKSGLIMVTNSVLKITSPPTATNTVGTVSGITVVKPGQAIGFSVGSYDADGNSLNCLWSFGDGATSVDCSPSHVFSNCGPHDVSVTVDDGLASVSTNMTMAVACPMDISALKMQVKFNHTGRDTCTIKGVLSELPAEFSIAKATVTLDVGEAQLSLQLNVKGRRVNKYANIKFTRHKKTGAWTFSGKMKGDYRAAWNKYGLVNGNAISVVAKVPVLLLLQSNSIEALEQDAPLSYTAKVDKSGTGRLIPSH